MLRTGIPYLLSFPRKRESSTVSPVRPRWTPAYAGVTEQEAVERNVS